MKDQDHRRQLAKNFQQQSSFAGGYSPLYARLFDIIARWLGPDSDEPAADWLVAASAKRPPFDVTLLLMAALHREVLAGEPAVAALSRYYPTADVWPAGVDGAGHRDVLDPKLSRRAGDIHSPELEAALRVAIMAQREALAGFIGRANVQTNETGRGLVWLLPVACLRWPAVHLVEMGASAGLNLVAEQRAYRIVDAADPARTLLALGAGAAPFITAARGPAEIPPLACCPAILSRTGGDLHPFYLPTAADELTLASFVWGDQPQRLARLRDGIAALRRVASTAAPVRLRPLRLPEELPDFLAQGLPPPAAPVVLFNTTVTMYLPDRGATMCAAIGEWAVKVPQPVLWLQWEPMWGGPPPPEEEWFAWSADYWPNDGGDTHHHFHLAWVHPHGTALEWAPGWADFLSITMQS